MLVAEARMALQYLERAEEWAAEVDNDIVIDMVLIHRRLLERIADMSPGPCTHHIDAYRARERG
jgi:hypothetical protein